MKKDKIHFSPAPTLLSLTDSVSWGRTRADRGAVAVDWRVLVDGVLAGDEASTYGLVSLSRTSWR